MLTAVSQRCAVGEHVCGDDWAVLQDGAAWLLAVIDGLGHGPEARHAAQLASATLRRCQGLPVDRLIAEMGRDLKPSRGACGVGFDMGADCRSAARQQANAVSGLPHARRA